MTILIDGEELDLTAINQIDSNNDTLDKNHESETKTVASRTFISEKKRLN